MGWNEAQVKKPTPILKDIPEGAHFYFVHSYYVEPKDSAVTAIEAHYHEPFCAMIWNDRNLFATQFHPEKSGVLGLKIIKNFAELTKGA